MAVNWQDAQRNEKVFWDTIYSKDHAEARPNYPRVDTPRAIRSAEKLLGRHGVRLADLPGKRLMDLGCGPIGIIKGIAEYEDGAVLDRMQGLFGVDPLMDTYENYGLIKPHEKIHLIKAKGEDVPLESKSFDYIFSSNAIDHCEFPEKVIAEAARLTKPDGLFCPSVHVLFPIYGSIAPVFKYLDKNHPHHFTEANFVSCCKKYFSSVETCFSATLAELRPEFRILGIFQSNSILRGLKRVASNYIIKTIYLNCSP